MPLAVTTVQQSWCNHLFILVFASFSLGILGPSVHENSCLSLLPDEQLFA